MSSYDELLYDVVKALLVRLGEEAEEDVGPFTEVTARLTSSEMKDVADNYTMSLQSHEHGDPNVRHVTLRLVSNDHPAVATGGLLDPEES